MSDKVTIVIPTRSRYETLRHAVRSALNQDYPNLEVLISDNRSDDETPKIATEFNDERVRYIRTPRRLGMSQNFEYGVSNAKPGWIAVIGDDDGLVPNEIGRAIHLLKDSNCYALASNTCHFKWPNIRDGSGSAMSIPCLDTSSVKSGPRTLLNVMHGRAGYNDLPLLYTGGIIHSKLIDQLRSCNGKIFNSCQPDIYSAIAIGRVCNRFVYTDRPFAISGVSKHSNGGTTWDKETFEPKGHAAIFMNEDNIPIHHQIPSVWNGKFPPFVPALVYESYLQSSILGGDIFEINAAQQAALFAYHKNSNHPFIKNWRQSFEKINSLNETELSNRNYLIHLRFGMEHFSGLLKNFASRYRFNDDELSHVHTVFDAGIVAATVLATRPSLMKSYAKTVLKRIDLISGKV